MTAPEAPPPPTVLLIEDSEDAVELTREALAAAGANMDLHAVADGISAMAFLRREGAYADKPAPDLVLLDLNLPRMDGREVLQAIRRDAELAHLPVVVLTTSESADDILQAYALHANCYITKPLDFLQFTEVMRQIEAFWLRLVKLPHRRSRP